MLGAEVGEFGSMQAVAPKLDTEGETQAAQVVAPAEAEYVFEGHGKLYVAPPVEEYEPAGTNVQMVAPEAGE